MHFRARSRRPCPRRATLEYSRTRPAPTVRETSCDAPSSDRARHHRSVGAAEPHRRSDPSRPRRHRSEVGTERTSNLVGDELPQRLSGDATDNFADQVPLTGCGGYPDVVRESHHGACSARREAPVIEVLFAERPVPSRYSGGVRQQMPDQDVVLARRGELGPVRRDRCIGIEQSRDRSALTPPGTSPSWWSTTRW